MPVPGNWAIAVHGGAGAISRETAVLPYEQALKAAVDAAHAVLEAGRNTNAALPWDNDDVPFPPAAVAAALAAVESMEACLLFNAGALDYVLRSVALLRSVDTASSNLLNLHAWILYCNIGKGAVLNARAFVENEASVMDGATMKTGATCGCMFLTSDPFHATTTAGFHIYHLQLD